MRTPPTRPEKVCFRWPSVAGSEPAAASGASGDAREGWGAERLGQRLHVASTDHVTPAAELVREAACEVRTWLRDAPPLAPRELGVAIEAGLAPWVEAHGHRGACALLVDALRRAFRLGVARGERALNELLMEELGLWTWTSPLLVGEEEWSGEPLAAGARLHLASEAAARAAALLERGHVVCLATVTELALAALERAHEDGRGPRVVLAPGGADGAGRRAASRLARAGLDVTLTHDQTLADHVHGTDRLWVGTESVGAEGFLARIGTRRVLAEAREHDVPIEVLATVDDLVPGGELELPRWCEREAWLLWEDAPRGVRLETQLFERVPFEAVDAFLTDAGYERPAVFHLRGLRTTPSPRCDA